MDKIRAYLKENNDRYFPLLVEEMTDYAIFLMTTEGIVASWNEGAELIKGYKEEEIIGKNYRILFSERMQKEKKPEMAIAKALKEGRFEEKNWRRRKNGEEFWARVVLIPLYDKERKLLGLAKITQDLSKEKQAEEKLQQKSEDLRHAKEFAEKLLKTQEIFIANVSHEIRTPMNAILGFTTLLQRSKLDEEQKEQLLVVNQSAELLLSILNDILDMSKIESGIISFEKTPFSIRNLLHSLKSMLLQKAAQKNIKLEINIDKNIPEILTGDPTRLTQILLNLAHNALKFTEKGKIIINVIQYSGSGANETVELAFEIIDTGIGIPSNKIKKVFERFEQANSDTTRKFGGTGLGLNIVKNLVTLQNGTLEVESKEGEGSTFRIVMPFQKTTEAELQESGLIDLKLETNEKVRILLVEDNIFNQKLALAVLKNFGLEVTLARNGKEAISILEKEKNDIILMDLQMPEMDGYATTEYIRKHISKSVPIIAMTADAMLGERENCLSHGMNDYISKPFKEKDLLNKILYAYRSVPES